MKTNTQIAKFITDDKETADCWVEDRKEFYPNSNYKTFKLLNYTDHRGCHFGGYAVATKASSAYKSEYCEGIADMRVEK